MSIYQEVSKGEKLISLVGLGYVGLPIALAFGKKAKVLGFDINAKRVELMKQGIDPSNELVSSDFEGSDIIFTADPADLKKAQFHIVAVPTPIDKHAMPDLTPLLSASRSVGRALKKGDYVVFESTVYPGCTEEDCVPILEAESGLKVGIDFKVGYSPERINPGDKEHTITKITKVVSGCDAEALENIASVYEMIVEAGVFRAASIKVAEAAKIIENTQRDVNIALMNELSKIFSKMNINTFEVLEAAGTKWNFLKFQPGLVGGHCIGVDPYYLTYKAKSLGYNPEVILSGRHINDDMGGYVAKTVAQYLVKLEKTLSSSKVLVMGVTFKENVSDIRNTKVVDIINELLAFGIKVDCIDAHADGEEFHEEYGLHLHAEAGNGYDAIITAVPHDAYKGLNEEDFMKMINGPALLADLKGLYKGKINQLHYWSL